MATHVTGRPAALKIAARMETAWSVYEDVSLTVDLVPVSHYATAHAAKGKARDRKLPRYECRVNGKLIGTVQAYQGTSARHYNRIRVVTGHPVRWSADIPGERSSYFRDYTTRKSAVYDVVKQAISSKRIDAKGEANQGG